MPRSSIPLLLLVSLALSACENGSRSSDTTLSIAVIPKGTTHVFWKSIEYGARRAGKELGVEIRWKGPLKEDEREGQRRVIESFITSSVDGIVLAPIDDHAMVGPVDQAMAAGKPVVIFDSGLKGENYVSFVATDNREGGRKAARRLAKILGEKGRVLFLRYQIGSASTDEREKGFIEIMKGYPGIEIVPPNMDQYAGATSGEAQARAESLLAKYTELDGIFCPNESSCTGMLQALENSGRAGKVKFVGFDTNEKLLQAMIDGKMQGLVLQDPVNMGDMAVRALVDHLRGTEVKKVVDTGVYLATPDNMKEPKMDLLLHPAIE